MDQPQATFDGHYQIVGELGRGTTGTVYEAWDTTLKRWVALKVPTLTPHAERWAKAQRFLWECRALASLTGGRGCNIPSLHVVTEYPKGHPYYVRELVEGSTLEQRAVEGSLELRAGLAIIAELAGVVQWIHSQGVAHRNLAAANVLVARDSAPWLIGFGRVGLLAGSPWLPDGAVGTPAGVDIRGLQNLVRWLCGTLRQPVPAALERATAPGCIATAEALGQAVVGYLRGSPAKHPPR